MKFFGSIISDLKDGENIEVYLVIIISLAVLILDIFGLVEFANLVEVVLAILALLSFGTLSTRKNLKSLSNSLISLDEKLERLEKNIPNKELSMFGLRGAHKDQSFDYIDQKFREAKNEIRILETWIPGVTPLRSAFVEAVRLGVKARILIMDPESEIAIQRLADQEFPKSTARPIAAYEMLQSAIQKNKLNDGCDIEVRFYKALPPFSLYLADEWMIVGVFWHNRSSIEGPHFEIYGRSSKFGWYILDTFEKMWNAATPVSL